MKHHERSYRSRQNPGTSQQKDIKDYIIRKDINYRKPERQRTNRERNHSRSEAWAGTKIDDKRLIEPNGNGFVQPLYQLIEEHLITYQCTF